MREPSLNGSERSSTSLWTRSTRPSSSGTIRSYAVRRSPSAARARRGRGRGRRDPRLRRQVCHTFDDRPHQPASASRRPAGPLHPTLASTATSLTTRPIRPNLAWATRGSETNRSSPPRPSPASSHRNESGSVKSPAPPAEPSAPRPSAGLLQVGGSAGVAGFGRICEDEPMKITRCATAVVEANYDYTFVRIHADNGPTGRGVLLRAGPRGPADVPAC